MSIPPDRRQWARENAAGLAAAGPIHTPEVIGLAQSELQRFRD
jgi:hypothetical protein